MSWLSVFFRQDSVKIILKLAEKILKIILGSVANDLNTAAWNEVRAAEASGKDGLDKYQTAFRNLRAHFPQIRESALNLSIELAVNALNEYKK